VKIMIASASDRASMSKTRLWTSRVLNAWLVLFLAFDAGVKALRLSVAVEGTTRLGYPEELVAILVRDGASRFSNVAQDALLEYGYSFADGFTASRLPEAVAEMRTLRERLTG
jgi:hypothetical protein